MFPDHSIGLHLSRLFSQKIRAISKMIAMVWKHVDVYAMVWISANSGKSRSGKRRSAFTIIEIHTKHHHQTYQDRTQMPQVFKL